MIEQGIVHLIFTCTFFLTAPCKVGQDFLSLGVTTLCANPTLVHFIHCSVRGTGYLLFSLGMTILHIASVTLTCIVKIL